jgi:hypothetical protein
MDTTIACPRCGANLIFQSSLESNASQTVCDFCGAHLSVTYENSVPQFTLLPEPETAAPDLAQFSPEATPDSATPGSDEPAPAPEPSPIPQEPFHPQEIPNPVTGEPSLPGIETPFSGFIQPEPPQKKKMNPWLIAAIVIVVVLCLCCVCGGLGIFLFINSGSSDISWVPAAGLFF